MFSSFLCNKLFSVKKRMISLDSTTQLVFFLQKSQFFIRPISSNSRICQNSFKPSSFIRFYSGIAFYGSSFRAISTTSSSNKDSFTVSYLINSCGLSPEIALYASEKIQFKTPEKPDKVLKLLSGYGFSKTQIAKLVRRRPMVLLANTEKTLLPKLEFFVSIGVSRTDLTKIISLDPTVLSRSLENHLKPSYKFLKSVLKSNEKVIASLKRTSWVFLEDHSKSTIPNIALLREIRVPESCIALLLAHFPEALMQKRYLFSGIVKEVQEMGFDPSKSMFVLAIHAIAGKGNKLIWNRCYEAYTKWGWSNDDILLAFKKHPHCMILSEKKLMKTMDIFVNKMGWESRLIARSPFVLFFSVEKRIIPRCSVIQMLSLKGLIKKNLSLGTFLRPAEKEFLDTFVFKYEKDIPQLFSVYEGIVDVFEL